MLLQKMKWGAPTSQMHQYALWSCNFYPHPINVELELQMHAMCINYSWL
jgi:hypothetical protein